MRKDQRNQVVNEEMVRQALSEVESVTFVVGRCVRVVSPVIKVGSITRLLPLNVVLPALGVSPQQAVPAFTTLNKKLSADVDRYEKLGAIPITYPPFQEIAALFNKRIEVVENYGGNIYRHLFTAFPDRKIFENIDAY